MQLIDCFTQILVYTGCLVGNRKGSGPSYDSVRKDYERLLAQSREAAGRANIPAKEYETGLFGVCAWVDEAILSSAWEGKAQWLGHELQRIYFHTTSAGEIFFTRLEQLPVDETSVRQVYATCLALGFTGRYFSEKDKPFLEELLNRQVHRIVAEEPLACIDQSQERLFPDAYRAPTVRRRKSFRRFPFLGLFFLLIPVLVLGGLFIAYNGILDGMARNLLSTLGIK